MRFEVIPEDSMVPSRLISGTIVQTVKVWMQRMMKIGRSVGLATRNAKYLDVLLAMKNAQRNPCLLYTSDAADDLLCVDLGGRRFLKKKK